MPGELLDDIVDRQWKPKLPRGVDRQASGRSEGLQMVVLGDSGRPVNWG